MKKSFRQAINDYKAYILSFAAVFFTVFIVYHHTVNFNFTYHDDTTIIMAKTENMDSFAKIISVLKEPVFNEVNNMFFRPFLNLSFFIDTVISGGELGFYHFSNIMLHIAAVFLILVFLTLLGYSITSSLCVSLLFAVHPALSSAVSWIPGRNDILLAIFIILLFIFFIKNLKSDKIYLYFLMFICMLSALLVKETAVAVPVLFVFYVIFDKIRLNKAKALKITFFILAAMLIYIFLRKAGMLHGTYVFNPAGITKNLFSSVFSLSWYLGITFFTEKLLLLPEFKASFEIMLKGLIPVLILALLAVVCRKNINFNRIWFGIIWFFVFLLPTFSMSSTIYHPHRLYLPLAGIMIVLLEIYSAVVKTYPKSKKAFCIIVPVLLLTFSFISYKRSFYYEDRVSFWFPALEENPVSAVPNAAIARYYLENNDYNNAEHYALKIINLTDKPSSIDFTRAGDVYIAKQDYEKALEYYRKAIQTNKFNEHPYLQISKYYESQENGPAAIDIIKQGLAIMPTSPLLIKRLKVLNKEIEDDGYIIIMKYNKN